jgi:hypothetical protein
LLVWQPIQKDEMPHRYDSERWEELWGRNDDQPSFARAIRLAGFPQADKTLLEVMPGDFRILSADSPDVDHSNRGADLDRLPAIPSIPTDQE